MGSELAYLKRRIFPCKEISRFMDWAHNSLFSCALIFVVQVGVVNSGPREKLKMPVFALSSMVRGYHAYKDILDADEGEILDCVRETTNHHDPYAVAFAERHFIHV